MTDIDHKDKDKDEDVYVGPPDYIPDEDLPPNSVAQRVAAGRKYTPHPTHDYNSTTGELVPRVKKSVEKKSFFDKKQG